MKKKIILILSMCALLVCLFVISASATTVTSPNFDFNDIDITQGDDRLMLYSFDTGDFMYSDFYCGGSNFWIFWNIEEFQARFNGYSYQEFINYCNENAFDSEDNSTAYMDLRDMSESDYNYFINYTSISQEDLTAQYNQGKIDGVTEYKDSEEYSSILEGKYTEGYGVGYNAFKESAEYESALETQYKLGSSTGVKNYIASEEYTNALQAEYDNGYEAATSENEQKEAKEMLATALGATGILIVVLLCWYYFLGKKGRKRR